MMKGFSRLLIIAIMGIITMTCITSCGSYSNASYEDSYNHGYEFGKAMRQIIDDYSR